MLPPLNRISLRTTKTNFEESSLAPLFFPGLKIARFDSKHLYPRLVVLVPKQASPLSVTRHQLKRLLHLYFQTHLTQIPPLDYLIVVRRQFLESFVKPQKQLFHELSQVFRS